MSRNEDYLDNLLTSVTDKLSEFDDDFEQNRESLKQSYQTQNDLPSKTQSALDEVREDNFLREFEQEFQNSNTENDFIREFERELDGDAGQSLNTPQADDSADQMEQIVSGTGVDSLAPGTSFETDPDLEEFFRNDFQGDSVLNDLFQDDAPASPLDDMPTAAFDDAQTAALDDMPTAAFDDVPTAAFDDVPTAALDDVPTAAFDSGQTTAGDSAGPELDFGEDFFSQLENGQEAADAGVPAGMEGLEDIFGAAPAADTPAEPVFQPEQTDVPEAAEQTVQMEPDLSAEIDSGLSEILNGSDEEALAELSGLLNPKEENVQKEEPLAEEKGSDPFSAGPDFSYAETADGSREESGKKRKEKKEKNPNSIFAKLSRILFGTPEELNPEMAAEYEAAKAAAGGDPDPKELKAKKKAEKELKKQQKKEEAELKKQEKDAAKAEKAAQKAAKAASKPKKEKKPKNKGPKEPPLPKVPVIMMWTLSLSMMVLILLAASLLGYSAPVNESREAFENGDYVTAYAKLQGVKVKKSDEELYHAASTLAGIQTQLDAYQALMEQKQYEMALDALIRGAGRCRLHSADAQEWGVTDQLNALETQLNQLLKEQFDVSKRSAKKLYNISKRSEYTLELHKILNKLGLY